MEQLIKLLSANKMLNTSIDNYTILSDETGKEHGVLFFIAIANRNYKVMIPEPHHLPLIQSNNPTAKQITSHNEAMLLK